MDQGNHQSLHLSCEFLVFATFLSLSANPNTRLRAILGCCFSSAAAVLQHAGTIPPPHTHTHNNTLRQLDWRCRTTCPASHWLLHLSTTAVNSSSSILCLPSPSRPNSKLASRWFKQAHESWGGTWTTSQTSHARKPDSEIMDLDPVRGCPRQEPHCQTLTLSTPWLSLPAMLPCFRGLPPPSLTPRSPQRHCFTSSSEFQPSSYRVFPPSVSLFSPSTLS